MTAKTVAMIMILLYNIRICQSRRYDNFTLYLTIPTEAEHLKYLQNLESQKQIDIIFWKKPHRLFEDVHFIVSPADKTLFIERTKHSKLKTDVMLHDVGKYVFTFLLRDDGSYGHALPPSQIIPSCEEIISGLTKLMVAKRR